MNTLFDTEPAQYQLRPYQQNALDEFFRTVVRTDKPGGMIRMPTGTGKTVVASAIVDRWLVRGTRRRALVLCHERQLVQQFANELQELTGHYVHIDMAGECASDHARLTVACRATYLAREKDGETVSRAYKFDPDDEWLLICDEAHRYKLGLKSCGHLFEHFGQNPNSKRLGLTATPERGDGVSLEALFPVVVQDYRYFDAAGGPCAINDGWAVPFDQRFVVVEGVDFRNLREVAGDFDDSELEQILTEQQTLAALVEPTKELVGDRRTIIFNATVSMAHRVANYLNAEAGYVIAQALDGSVADQQRREVYAAHQRGDFQYMCVCGLCREGYNDPGVGAIAVFRPTKSRALAEQMKGRGSRPLRGLVDGLETAEERRAAIAASDKPDCMIVDLVGITGLAGARTCIDCYADGLPDEVVERAGQLLEEEHTHDPAQAIQQAEQQLAEERAEKLKREQEEAERRAKLKAEVQYRAQQVKDGQGSLQSFMLGPESPSEKQLKYLRWQELPMKVGMTKRQASRIISMHKDGASIEDICYRNGMRMEDVRREPPTSKQIWKLRSLGIAAPKGLSKKQASQMIDARVQRAGA